MRLLVCGTRDGVLHAALVDVLCEVGREAGLRGDRVVLIHGDARGVDTQAANIGERLGWWVWPCPAEWEAQGRAAGGSRNQRMLDEGRPELVIACPGPRSRGTWDMVRRAQQAGVPTQVYSSRGRAEPLRLISSSEARRVAVQLELGER